MDTTSYTTFTSNIIPKALQKGETDLLDKYSSYIITLFLLTSDDMFWKLWEWEVSLNGFDFSDLDKLGKDLYLGEKIAVSSKEFEALNGENFNMEVIRNNFIDN